MSDSRDPACVRLRFRLPKAEIKYVKWLVEARDGLAVVSSPKGRGEMEWVVPEGMMEEAVELAEALEQEVGLIALSPLRGSREQKAKS